MTEQNQYTYIMNIDNPMILNSTAYTIHKLFKDKVSNSNWFTIHFIHYPLCFKIRAV